MVVFVILLLLSRDLVKFREKTIFVLLSWVVMPVFV